MMAKILVVDDEADMEVLIRQKFRKQIRDNQYSFLFANNGVQALESLDKEKDIDLVLSDINMPEMDGLTLLSKLSEKNTLLKSIILSAYGDMDNIRTAMNRGAFDFITKPINFDDLEITIEKTLNHISQLKQTVQTLKENSILKMYVDETVLNFMGTQEFEEAIVKNETIEGTVVFMDICGFTRISESETPDAVIKLLNTLFDLMVKEIVAYNGMVDKFIGDAVMALFRGDSHLENALHACLGVRDHLSRIAIDQDLSFRPQVSIGVNCGEMISGNIGSTELKKLDFTVIGDVVNIAQRLESIAAPSQILLPQNGYELAKSAFRFSEVKEVSLKNKSKPLQLYEVLGTK